MNITTRLLTIAVLLAMCSCSEKEDVPVGPEGTSPIEFGTVATRALVSSITDVDEFGVSIAISNNEPNAGYGSIMDNERVYPVDEAHTKWDYDNKRYWLEDSRYYFVASYPYVLGGGFQTQEVADENGVTRVGYILNVDTYDETLHDQIGTDILTASKYVDTSDPWNNTVDFQLRHLLTNVNFEITQDVDNDPNSHYYITGVSLYGISTNGTYAVVPNGDQLNSIWDLENVSSDVSFDKSFNEELLENGKITVWGNEGLLLIPQDIPRESAKLRIDYLYQLEVTDAAQGAQAGNSQEAVKQKRSEIINLPMTDQWKSGNRIKYTLSFAKPTKIVFTDISVKPWGSAQSGGTIIIK